MKDGGEKCIQIARMFAHAFSRNAERDIPQAIFNWRYAAIMPIHAKQIDRITRSFDHGEMRFDSKIVRHRRPVRQQCAFPVRQQNRICFNCFDSIINKIPNNRARPFARHDPLASRRLVDCHARFTRN